MHIETAIVLNENTPFAQYSHRIEASITLDGLPYAGIIELLQPGMIRYLSSLYTEDGTIRFSLLAESLADAELSILLYKDGRPFTSELITPDNVVIYNLAISTSGGGAPTGNPGTITGKVERVLDNQPVPVARALVAVENKPDGTWAVTGNTTSDNETGTYTLDVLTDGGDTYVLAIDDYGRAFTPSASVEDGEILHPTTPNGYVYRVEQAGTLPDVEPDWWIDTGTNHTRTINGVLLRAIAYNRPLCHGALTVDTD